MPVLFVDFLHGLLVVPVVRRARQRVVLFGVRQDDVVYVGVFLDLELLFRTLMSSFFLVVFGL